MADIPRCPECDAEIPANAPRGLCPRCLLRAGLVGETLSLARGGEPAATVELEGAGVVAMLSDIAGPGTRLRDTDPAPFDSREGGPRAGLGPSGRYRLLGEIARGGMGAVIRAHDAVFGRDLAFKVLLDAHHDRPEMIRRFVEEARIGGQLQHPGIVPVHEIGAFADQRPYFTMKLVKGRTLAALLKDRADPTQDLPRFLSIFEQICQTMAYAHSRGVIHRDLKPANVMVGAFGEVQVMDWGLAKVLASEGGTAAGGASVDSEEGVVQTGQDSESRAGAVLGTPEYMPPEQAKGEIERIDERADVFGLGAILCAILTGKPPYVGTSGAEVYGKSTRADLADAMARLDACGADAELVALAKDCLVVDPADRPRHAGEVAQRVTAYLSGVQERLKAAELARVEAQARAREEQAKAIEERKRRKLTTALAASLLALFALGGGGYAWVQSQRSQRRARTAEAVNVALAEAARLRGEALAAPAGDLSRWGEATAKLKGAQDLITQGEAAASLKARVAVLLAQAGRERAEAEDRARKLQVDRNLLTKLESIRGGRAEHDNPKQTNGEYATAFREAGLDLDAVDPAAAGRWVSDRSDPVELASYLDDWVSVRREAKSPESSWRRLVAAARGADSNPWRDALRSRVGEKDEKAIEEFRKLADDVKSLDEQPAASLVLLAGLLKNDAMDRSRAERVLRLAWTRFPGDFWVNFELAAAPGSPGEGGDARDLYPRPEEALRYLSAAVAVRPRSAMAQSVLGIALLAQGKLDEAVAAFGAAIRLEPAYSTAYYNLGDVLVQQGKLDEAVAVCRESIRLQPDDAGGRINLGNALLAQGNLDEAEAAYREAIRLKPDFAQAHSNLGNVLRVQSRLDEAVAAHREAIRLKPDDAMNYLNLGSVLDDQGKNDEAETAYHEAIRLQPGDAMAHCNLGSTLKDQGKLVEAVAELREAIRLQPAYAKAHALLGDALQARGDLEDALTPLRRARELAPPGSPLDKVVAGLVQQVEQQIALGSRLPGVLKGDDGPKDAAEGLAFAQLCVKKGLYVAAARLWRDAFAADPKLGDDRETQPRYNAACSAALAGTGKAKDDPPPDNEVRAKLRSQALEWLNQEQAAWAKLLAEGPKEARPDIIQTLRHWKEDADLAGVRDPEGLETLPAEERKAWRALWEDVDALLKKAHGGQP